MSLSPGRYELAAKSAKINLALSQRSSYLIIFFFFLKKKKEEYKEGESRQAFIFFPSMSMTYFREIRLH